MTALLELKQRLKLFYTKYDVLLIPVVRFIFAFAAFQMINSQMGFMSKVNNPLISILLAVLCALISANMVPVLGALLILAHAYAVSLEVLAVAAVLLIVMYAIYFRVAAKYGYLMMLTPLMFVFKIPYVIPLVFGLIGGPACAVPAACGTVLYYFMNYLKNNQAMLSNSESSELLAKLTSLVDNILKNKAMILTMIVFAVTLVVVYAIHKLSVAYSWHIAIGVGAAVNVVCFLIGMLVMSADISVIGVIFGTLVSAGFALLVEFFVLGVDYSRTEYTQFEDNDYYYYVKAIPKNSIAVPERRIKKINTRRKSAKKPAVKKQEQ